MLIDICSNLLNSSYTINTDGNSFNDIDNIIHRANKNGVERIILCCSTLEETEKAQELCEKYESLYFTLGIHPMSIKNYKKVNFETIRKKFTYLATTYHYPKGKLVAFGEMGLDYFRKEYVSLDLQKTYFKFQLELVKDLNLDLPILFHCRQAADLFVKTVSSFPNLHLRGVVHSFSDGLKDLKILLSTNFYIGLNGVAFREKETIDAIKSIPLDRVLLETDAPYCRISKSYHGHKYILDEKFEDKFKSSKNKKKYKIDDKEYLLKGRNEPCKVVEIYNAYCNLKEIEKNELEEKVLNNCINLFWNK